MLIRKLRKRRHSPTGSIRIGFDLRPRHTRHAFNKLARGPPRALILNSLKIINRHRSHSRNPRVKVLLRVNPLPIRHSTALQLMSRTLSIMLAPPNSSVTRHRLILHRNTNLIEASHNSHTRNLRHERITRSNITFNRLLRTRNRHSNSRHKRTLKSNDRNRPSNHKSRFTTFRLISRPSSSSRSHNRTRSSRKRLFTRLIRFTHRKHFRLLRINRRNLSTTSLNFATSHNSRSGPLTNYSRNTQRNRTNTVTRSKVNNSKFRTLLHQRNLTNRHQLFGSRVSKLRRTRINKCLITKLCPRSIAKRRVLYNSLLPLAITFSLYIRQRRLLSTLRHILNAALLSMTSRNTSSHSPRSSPRIGPLPRSHLRRHDNRRSMSRRIIRIFRSTSRRKLTLQFQRPIKSPTLNTALHFNPIRPAQQTIRTLRRINRQYHRQIQSHSPVSY